MKIQSGMILNKAVKYQKYDMHVYVNSESMKYFVILVSLPKSICKSVSIDQTIKIVMLKATRVIKSLISVKILWPLS